MRLVTQRFGVSADEMMLVDDDPCNEQIRANAPRGYTVYVIPGWEERFCGTVCCQRFPDKTPSLSPAITSRSNIYMESDRTTPSSTTMALRSCCTKCFIRLGTLFLLAAPLSIAAGLFFAMSPTIPAAVRFALWSYGVCLAALGYWLLMVAVHVGMLRGWASKSMPSISSSALATNV